MKQHKKSFRHDSLQDTQSVLKILHAVIEGLETGNLVLSDNHDEIILNPDGLLQLKLTASQDDTQCTLAVKVSWQVKSDKGLEKNALRVFAKKKNLPD